MTRGILFIAPDERRPYVPGGFWLGEELDALHQKNGCLTARDFNYARAAQLIAEAVILGMIIDARGMPCKTITTN